MSDPNVRLFDNSDPVMQQAYERARATFRYFWREVAWERRRIVPALSLYCVKAPFHDPGRAARGESPDTEHMWIGEVDFDGKDVTGVLLNTPNWLTNVKERDPARIALDEISDWMYAIGDEVYGAFTVNVLRAGMSEQERARHDGAWGLDFGDPDNVRVVPEQMADRKNSSEHAMSENMGPSLREYLQQDASRVHATDDRGWTFLHQLALAGSSAGVRVMLEAGADVNAVTDHGMTALQLARSLGWDGVAALLLARGAR